MHPVLTTFIAYRGPAAKYILAACQHCQQILWQPADAGNRSYGSLPALATTLLPRCILTFWHPVRTPFILHVCLMARALCQGGCILAPCASLIFKCTGQPCRDIFCGPGGDTVVGPLGAPWHRMCHHGTMVERERPSAAQGSGPMRSCMCTQVQCCTRPALGFRTQVHGCAPPALPSQTKFPGCAPTALPFRAGIQCGAHPALLTEPDSAEQNPHIHGQPGLDSRISDLRGLAGTHYVPRQRARQQ